MNGITMWMEKYLVPVAAKIGSQKHLVALRDSFIGILPATLSPCSDGISHRHNIPTVHSTNGFGSNQVCPTRTRRCLDAC